MLSYLFPGQGSQFKGMGKELFQSPLYASTLERKIDEILGYSLKEMCLNGSEEQLRRTEITQPCLYVVNALHYLKSSADRRKPDYLAGHSLGEYSALFAAGAFDILTGLRLVVRRGQLMAAAPKGAMAAVLGLRAEEVEQALKTHDLLGLDLANFNTPSQIVIAGPDEEIQRAEEAMISSGASGYIQLPVGAPFHSRYMAGVARDFSEFINHIEFEPLNCTVISNVTARPYPREGGESMRTLLVQQIKSQVLWCPSIGYMKAKGVEEFLESGPGMVLGRMLAQIPATVLEAEKHPDDSAMAPTALAENDETETELTEGENTTIEATSTIAFSQQKKIAPVTPEMTEAGGMSPVFPQTSASSASHDSGAFVNETLASVTDNILPIPEASVPLSIEPEALGSETFRSDYGVRYAYVAGAMFKGIASQELVVAMGRRKLLSYFGTGGMKLEAIEEAIRHIQKALPHGPYGMNLLYQPGEPGIEERTVECFLQHGIRNVEAAGYMSLTPAIVRFRAAGLEAAYDGRCISRHRILAKVSRPEVAALFMRPAPESIVHRLLDTGKITQTQAELARTLPMADDICVEADSGGHTDGGVAITLFPDILLLRDEICREYTKPPQIRVGAAGGIGTPHAAAAAFTMGADFILTGSINQCTIEAGTSESVKDLLESIEVQDTAYAPAGDLFEYGAKIQVVRKGLFFHTRADMLYDLYTRYSSLDEIPAEIKNKIENKYFKKKLSEVWEENKVYYSSSGSMDMSEVERNPKMKMALTFKWYFVQSNRLALEGREEQKVNYQIQCGPAMGAFNRWVKGTSFESWRNRHVAEIAEWLMKGTAEFLAKRMNNYYGTVPQKAIWHQTPSRQQNDEKNFLQ